MGLRGFDACMRSYSVNDGYKAGGSVNEESRPALLPVVPSPGRSHSLDIAGEKGGRGGHQLFHACSILRSSSEGWFCVGPEEPGRGRWVYCRPVQSLVRRRLSPPQGLQVQYPIPSDGKDECLYPHNWRVLYNIPPSFYEFQGRNMAPLPIIPEAPGPSLTLKSIAKSQKTKASSS